MNIELNSGDILIDDYPGAIGDACNVRTKKLDWHDIAMASPVATFAGSTDTTLDISDHTLLEKGETFNVIIGSDLICCLEDANGVINATYTFLSVDKDAIAIFVCPTADHRFGMESLVAGLDKRGLHVSSTIIRHSTCCLSVAGDVSSSCDNDDLFEGLQSDHVESTAFVLVLCRVPSTS